MISREEIEKAIPFEGENVGWAHGPTNCHFCEKLVNDYWFIGEKPVCEKCMPPEDLTQRRRHVAICSLALWALEAREWMYRVAESGPYESMEGKDYIVSQLEPFKKLLAKFPESK